MALLSEALQNVVVCVRGGGRVFQIHPPPPPSLPAISNSPIPDLDIFAIAPNYPQAPVAEASEYGGYVDVGTRNCQRRERERDRGRGRGEVVKEGGGQECKSGQW